MFTSNIQNKKISDLFSDSIFRKLPSPHSSKTVQKRMLQTIQPLKSYISGSNIFGLLSCIFYCKEYISVSIHIHIHACRWYFPTQNIQPETAERTAHFPIFYFPFHMTFATRYRVCICVSIINMWWGMDVECMSVGG